MKKGWGICIGAMTLVFSTSVLAASLGVDSSIELMAFDGKEIKSSDLTEGRLENISVGSHQVVYRFYSELRDGSSNRILSTTPNVSEITFNQNDDLTITIPLLRSYSQGQAYFRRDGKWFIEDSKGGKKALTYEELPGQGFMPYADIEKPLAAYNLSKANQYAPVGATKVITDEVITGGNDLSLLNTFKLLYQNANDVQKKQIRDWLATQN